MQSCRANSGCNAWVFCGHTGGCNDGYGKVYPFGTCTLKNQGGIEAMGSDPPVVYGSYGTSDFTSGKMVTEGAVTEHCLLDDASCHDASALRFRTETVGLGAAESHSSC